jgi:hypothetical protein
MPGSNTLVSLQKGAAQAQIGSYWEPAPLINLGPEIRDCGDTTAIVEALDLLVTVDTSVAHLAGAMGKAGLDHAPLCAGLAMAARTKRQPLVPIRPLVPAIGHPRLATRYGGDRGGNV